MMKLESQVFVYGMLDYYYLCARTRIPEGRMSLTEILYAKLILL